MIDRATVDRILDAANIVDVVSDFVTLRRAGANLKGLCPFHDDRTPSFMVSPSKNICKCFACGEGGTPVHFIMKHEQLTYPEALRYLAKKYNIEIKERELSDEEKAQQSERESLFVVNEWANNWFQHQLHETVDGRAVGLAYFRHRGFRDDIIKKFQIGFCPDKRDQMWREGKAEGYNPKYLIDTGLCIEHDNGTPTDRFRGRVIFPIHTVSGKVVGFGGRVLDAATKGVAVKYQNSPESLIYSKKRELYGLWEAKQAIVKQDLCYLVEGYTDVMSMHQMGVENVVASSGTALTHEQIHAIHRFTGNITVIYDGDAAGIKASQRGIDMLLAEGINVKLLLLPDGDDPDSFARKHSAEEYQAYLKEHQVDFLRFKTDLLQQESKGDPLLMSRLVNSIVDSLSVIPDDITRTFYIKETAQMLSMEERLLTTAVTKKRREDKERPTPERPTPDPSREGRGEAGAEVAGAENAGTENASGEEASGNESLPSRGDLEGSRGSRRAIAESLFNKKERLLIEMLVRFGEQVLCDVEDEDGKVRPLTVIEYIHYTLEQDGLEMRDATHRRMMQLAMEHLHEEGFNATLFFQNNEHEDIARLATELSINREPLSRIYDKDATMIPDEKRLMELVPRVMMDYKLAIVREEMKQLLRQMRDPKVLTDKDARRELMSRIQDLKKVEGQLAKECGDRVVMR